MQGNPRRMRRRRWTLWASCGMSPLLGGWAPPLHCLACSRLLPLFWELEKTHLPRSSPRGGPVLRGTSSLFILYISWVFGAGPRYRLPLPCHRLAPQHSALRPGKLPPQRGHLSSPDILNPAQEAWVLCPAHRGACDLLCMAGVPLP